MIPRPALFAALLLPTTFAAAQAPRPMPALADATRIYDCKADAARTWPELLDALAKLDAVFLGETHVDDVTHQTELHVLEELLQRRHGKVVLSMEMFERDVQPVLDDYLAGRIDEAAFLQRARPWENYQEAYRPLIEAAKAAGIPVVAANFPAPLRRVFAGGGGKQALDALPPQQRALVPDEIFPASDKYWERVDRAVRGHMGGGGGGTAEERLWDTQNLWDNAMGDSVARARKAHPDSLVLHVAGGFHVAYHDGTVAQFHRRDAASTFAVVSLEPTSELFVARPDRDRDEADYLVYARTLARDLNEGNYAVEVPAELRYRLEVPDRAPANASGWPLLVWLPDRFSRTDDAVATWLANISDGAAVAVVEAPFPEIQPDLATGGRYVFGDGYRADYSRVSSGLARLVEFATRRYPIDGKRVVVAGAGDGGAVVLWTALYGQWLDADFLAFEPNDLTRLSMEALPDQKPVAKSLLVAARNPEDPRMQKLVADYQQVGTPTTIASSAPSSMMANRIRQRLGLQITSEHDIMPAPRLQLVLDTPRAREWMELHRAMMSRAGMAATVVEPGVAVAADAAHPLRRLEVGGDGPWPVTSFADGSGIPLAGGPFGGTTVVVLPKGTSDADRATWLELEQKKVLKRRSMFANIAIASEDGEPSLPSVMTKLKSMHRSRVLIVPAAFCVDAATMQGLQHALGDTADGMDVSWLPGLGAELAAKSAHGH